ncbi:MAG: guanylate kinase [Chloroflexota bacterium]
MIENVPPNGVLIVLVGPAGVGKNTIMKQVMEKLPVRQMPTVTTRPMRPNEEEGREHYFVSLDEFRQKIADKSLVEWQEVYPGTYYGTPHYQMQAALDSGENLVADIEVLGATELKKAFPNNVVLIFIAPPDLNDLDRRLRTRGHMSEDEIAERLKRANFELKFAEKSDYRVVNDDLESSVQKVTEIINQELLKQEKA